MDVVFVVNPRAGRGRGKTIARELPERIAARGIEGRVLVTTGAKDAIRLARDAATARDPDRDVPPRRLVVAVGGDGTASEVVNGLAETNAVFGLVPVGSGNDLALALGIPGELDAALDVLARGRETRIDLGRYDDGWFANSIGIGFEAQVTIESLGVKYLRGFAVYLWAVVKALRGLRCADYRIRADEREFEGRRLLVCVGNGSRVGGGFLLTPDARPDDGVFDLCLADALSRWNVLRLLPRSLNGSHVSHPAITMTRARRITIESADGFPFHADGEVIDRKRHRLAIELVPSALAVRVPEA